MCIFVSLYAVTLSMQGIESEAARSYPIGQIPVKMPFLLQTLNAALSSSTLLRFGR